MAQLSPLRGWLLAAGILALFGRSPAAWTRIPVLAAWSVAWALPAAVALKHAIGRSWAELYAARGVYGFHPLHGGSGYEAFPSGTTTVAGAVLAVLWIRVPRLRAACVLLLAAISGALVATNSHWVSDVVAGSFLGAAIGTMTLRPCHGVGGQGLEKARAGNSPGPIRHAPIGLTTPTTPSHPRPHHPRPSVQSAQSVGSCSSAPLLPPHRLGPRVLEILVQPLLHPRVGVHPPRVEQRLVGVVGKDDQLVVHLVGS